MSDEKNEDPPIPSPGELRQRGEFTPINITGYLMPWRINIPQPFHIHIGAAHFVIIFSTEEKLRAFMAASNITVTAYRIKQIDDGIEFLASLYEQGQRIAVDPWHDLQRMTTRFIEIKANG